MGISRGTGSLSQNAFWLMLGKTAGFAFAFLLPLFLVRHMSQRDFGLYKQAFLVVNTAITVFPLGFAMSAFYFLPRESARRGQVVFNVLLFYFFAGLLVCITLAIRPELLAVIFNAADLIEHAPLIGAVIIVWFFSSCFEYVAVANGEAPLAAAFLVAAHLTRSSLLIAAAIFFTSLGALLYAALIHGVLQAAALLLYLGWRFPGFWRRFDGSLMRSQLAYALPLGFAGLLWGIQLDVHHYFVSNRFGPAVYAIYAVGCFELPLVGILRESVGSVMIARVSALRHENNLREIVLLTVEVMRRLAAFFFPVYLFFLVTARDLIALLFRAQYMESWPIFAVNLTLIPLGLIGTAYDPVFRAHPEHRYFVLRTQIVSFLLLLAGLWLGIGHFGLVGAISAVVAVNLVQHLILGARAARILELTWRDLPLFKDIGKLACAGLAAGAVGAGVRELLLGIEPFIVLSVCGAVFALIYLASVYFLKVLSPEELGSIQRAASQLRHGLRKRAAGSLVG